MDYIINELSLRGQFSSVEDFLTSIKNITIVTLSEIGENEGRIYKSYSLNQKMITETTSFYEVLKLRTDEARKIKSILLSSVFREPYWEDDRIHDSEKIYSYDDEVITDTSIAEAYEREIPLISFENHHFPESLIVENEKKQAKILINIVKANDVKKHQEAFYREVDILKFCKVRYFETKINFNLFENEEYGFSQLEKSDFSIAIRYLDKFCSYPWSEILKGNKPFYYKKYQPSSKEDDWFKTSPHKDKSIDKFRISFTHDIALRCYGFRDKDEFFILRIEKNHDISDNG